MSLLPPAYRGAPYRQPRPLSRRHRAMRVLVPAGIAAAVLLLIIIVGVLLTHAGVP
jgi:hypothetical protein